MTARRTARMRSALAAGVAAMALAVSSVVPSTSHAQSPPPAATRVALVIGEGAYRAGPTPAAPDDAGLVAQVLAGAGIDVTGARDLDGDGLRRAFRDFLDKAGAAGPDGIAIVYLAGRAIQSDGDDFFLPVDARLARAADVPIEALRLADVARSLAALPIQARVVIVDGAYGGGATAGGATAPGLALLEAEQGELVAFNAAPGTVAPPTAGPYGPYAQALVAALQQGGVPIGEVFARVRLAVNQATGGAVVPWESDRLTRGFTVFDRAPGAPAVSSAQVPFAALDKRPLRDFPPDQAYDVALARDTLPAYAEFLAAFPADPLARRVRLILAVRREALVWRAVLQGASPSAYWTYLARYPKGPHAADARRRLTRLAAAAAPPARFVPVGFDVPPPGPDEIAFDRVIVFDAPGLPPPPPPPVFLLPPLVAVVLERPASPRDSTLLPMPVAVALPYVRTPVEPGTIAPPRGVAGAYPRPRPYARGAGGDGLVVQAPSAASDGRPRPAGPSAAQPAIRPTPLPVPPIATPAAPSPTGPAVTRPPAATTAGPPDAARPAAPRAPTPAAPSSASKPPTSTPPGAHRPASPTPAAAGPAVTPAVPPAPALSAPPAVPPKPAVHPTPAAPAPAAPRTPTPPHEPPTRPLPPPPSPHAVPPAPRLDQPPAVPTPRRLPPSPADAAPASRPAAADRTPAPATAPVRQVEHPPAASPQPRPPAPERPAPERPAPERPAAGAGRPPGDRRAACGHPGEPPCRP